MLSATCTVIVPVAPARRPELLDLLAAVDADPVTGPLPFGTVPEVHYAAAMLLEDDAEGSRLILELNGDGTPRQLVEAVLRRAPAGVAALLRCCRGWPDPETPEAVRRHVLAHLVPAGAGHVGNVGRTVEQVRAEAALRDAVLDQLDAWRRAGELPDDPAEVARRLRSWLRGHPTLDWALHPGPARRTALERLRFRLRLAGLVAAAVPALPVLLPLLAWIRVRERLDPVADLPRDDLATRELEDQEDRPGWAVNHLVSVVPVKPGSARIAALRTVLAALDRLARVRYDEGRLGSIDSIHFAHWSVIDGGRNLLFCSNFDGSWESYLDDFIEKASKGLTAVWSHGAGFPRTRWVVLDGATDGARFKAWARASQLPLRAWYSAYPGLTVRSIDEASALRDALARPGAPLPRWLAPDPAAPAGEGAGDLPATATPDLPVDVVQAVVLRGHGDLPAAAHLAVGLPADAAAARAWLAALVPSVTAASAPRADRALQVALSAPGLRRLGVPEPALATFSRPFLEGMCTPHRSRILGDVGASDPRAWAWGARQDSDDEAVDALLVAYAVDHAALDAQVAALAADLRAVGGRVLADLRSDLPDDRTEHFGFVDGVSQPILTGTRAAATADRWSRLAAGEVVLGLPDEGEGPPAPVPCLPGDDAAARGALGFGGTYLVIRQLHQDVAAFRRVTLAAGGDAAGAERVAAELVGRRLDGTTLVAGAPAAAARSLEAPEDPASPVPNDFGYAATDRQGLGCPLGAHVRRANPRDTSGALGPDEALRSTRRHRILRRGRRYGPPLPEGALEDDGAERGLVFVGLVADLARQLEFVQQHWLNGRTFAALGEVDPITGSQVQGDGRATVQTCPVAERHDGLVDLTTTRGGAYLFLPSIPALRRIAAI